MLFSQFIVDRLQLLNRATCGYGNQISERSLYETLLPDLNDPADFPALVSWGLVTGLLVELRSEQGRRFGVERAALSAWRARANGEPPFTDDSSANATIAATRFNNRPLVPPHQPRGLLPPDKPIAP
ncbi:MAG: hypothetical protein ACRBC3_03660 [Burkholderiaceae bacterium]